MVEGSRRRRRGAELEASVLDAAWEEIYERGYSAFTVDSVAARARTSKAVLYRRWSSRAELARAAIERFFHQHPLSVPDTGSLRGDVLEYLRNAAENSVQTEALLFARFVEFQGRTGTSLKDLIDAIVPTHQSIMAQMLKRAIERGEVDEGKITDRITRLPADLFRLEVVMTGHPLSESGAEEVVDTIFLPLLQ